MAYVHCYRCDQDFFHVTNLATNEEVECPNCDNKGPVLETPAGGDGSKSYFWLSGIEPEDPNKPLQ